MSPETEEIFAWLDAFEKCVNSQDFEKAKPLFHPDTYCFGSYSKVMTSWEELCQQQWQKVWPNITDFRFDRKNLHCLISDDHQMACVMAPWASTGYDKNGKSFERPGRVTIILMKDKKTHTWLAHHSHYSLFPGSNQTVIKK